MKKNTGKVQEFCQSGKVGTMSYIPFTSFPFIWKMQLKFDHVLQPTLYYGNPCPYTASPYINDCDYNMAFVNLDYLLDGLVEPEPNMTIPGQVKTSNLN